MLFFSFKVKSKKHHRPVRTLTNTLVCYYQLYLWSTLFVLCMCVFCETLANAESDFPPGTIKEIYHWLINISFSYISCLLLCLFATQYSTVRYPMCPPLIIFLFINNVLPHLTTRGSCCIKTTNSYES